MSWAEAQVIEWAFVVALGLMGVGLALGLRAGSWSSDPQPAPGRVAPAGLLPIDLAGVAVVASLYFGFHWVAARGPTPVTEQPEITPAGLAASIVTHLLILGMVLAMILPRVRAGEFFGLRWSRWPQVLWIGPTGTVAAWILIGTLQAGSYFRWMQDRLGAPVVQESVSALRESSDPAVLVLMALAAVLVAPLAEELVFRGYVYPVVKRFGGRWTAAAGSALLFAAAHNHAAGILPLCGLGLILVAAYELTGSLWAPIAVHACFNGVTVALTFLLRLLEVPFNTPP
jgi:hypothetical protein